MKKILIFSLLLTALMPVCVNAQNQVKKKVAVYVMGDADNSDQKVVANTMISALTMSDNYVAVERMNDFINELNKEIDNQTSGAVRDKDIAAIGQRYGAKFVDVIEVSEIRGEMYIAARMVDVESAAVIASYQNSAPVETMEQLRKLARDVAGRLLGLAPGGSNVSQSGYSGSVGQNRTFTVNGISFEMVAVPGGSFMMGSYEGYCEKPVHQETVRDFMIGKTEVTQELWRAVMGSNPSYFNGEKNPVECVSWTDCITFVNRLNQLTGQNFRLPTEAEWEYAARGGNKSRNYKYSGSDDLYMVSWFSGNSGNTTHPVATLQPNELGIYDMSGNVWEWTSDLWSDNYNVRRNGGPSGSDRVNRGGNWGSIALGCRVDVRGAFSPGDAYNNLGLRLAL